MFTNYYVAHTATGHPDSYYLVKAGTEFYQTLYLKSTKGFLKFIGKNELTVDLKEYA